MSYTPTTWTTGDTITATKMNKIEQGIANAGGGGMLIITVTDGVLDKTWQEIYDAMVEHKLGVIFVSSQDSAEINFVVHVYWAGNYTVDTMAGSYVATTADDYPVLD